MSTGWGNRCYRGTKARVVLFGGGVVFIHPAIVEATLAMDQVFRAYNYRTEKHHTGAYNCRTTTNGARLSDHGLAIAEDVNWLRNPYSRRRITDMPAAMTRDITSIRTNGGVLVWDWGGYWGLNGGTFDTMHYAIKCTPQQLGKGIDPRTVRGSSGPIIVIPTTVPRPTNKPPLPTTSPIIEADPEDDDMKPFLIQHDASAPERNLNGACKVVWGSGILTPVADDNERIGLEQRGFERKVVSDGDWQFWHRNCVDGSKLPQNRTGSANGLGTLP